MCAPESQEEPRTLFEGRYKRFVVREDWEFIQHVGRGGVAAIIALTAEGNLVLVEQYRPAVGRRVIELPAGLAGDGEGNARETLAGAARRELFEETGYECASLELLLTGPSSVGISDEIISFYLARGLRRSGPGGGDDAENIIVREARLQSLAPWLKEREAEGCLIDPRVYLAAYFLQEQAAR